MATVACGVGAAIGAGVALVLALPAYALKEVYEGRAKSNIKRHLRRGRKCRINFGDMDMPVIVDTKMVGCEPPAYGELFDRQATPPPPYDPKAAAEQMKIKLDDFTSVKMQMGEPGSGLSRGGGGGGSIRDAGGAFGKLEAAREGEYFHKLQEKQIAEMKKQLQHEIQFSEAEVVRQRQHLEASRARLAELEQYAREQAEKIVE
ncbi:unnamed protein product, partial [Mesorhabditis spiculigera]